MTWPRNRSLLVTALLVTGLFGLAAVLRPPAEGGVDGVAEEVRLPVETVVLREEPVLTVVEEGGYFEARHDVTISAERSGRLVALPVREGRPVAAGAEIAHIEDTIARARLAEARVLHRETLLNPETDAATRARAQAQLDTAAHEVRLRHPTSPVAGIVDRHHVDVGEFVQIGTPLVDVVDSSRVKLEVQASGEILGLLRLGQEVEVQVGALGVLPPRKGTVVRMSRRAHARSRRFPVELELEGGNGLRPGMYGIARFRLRAATRGIYVPKQAVRTVYGETGVFRVDKGAARWTPVRVFEVPGVPASWRVESDVLATGARIVIAGFSGLRTGTLVRDREPAGSEEAKPR